jgi:hypothetical protein
MPAYTQICRPTIFEILCRNRDAGLSDLQGWRSGIYGPGLAVRHIWSRVWPTVISGIYKSTEVSHPCNQGRKHPGMEAEYSDRVHSGGIPTLTVHKYKLTSEG